MGAGGLLPVLASPLPVPCLPACLAAAQSRRAQADPCLSAHVPTLLHESAWPPRSGVAKERKVFMDLMRNEIDRVNTVLAKSGEGARGCMLGCVGGAAGFPGSVSSALCSGFWVPGGGAAAPCLCSRFWVLGSVGSGFCGFWATHTTHGCLPPLPSPVPAAPWLGLRCIRAPLRCNGARRIAGPARAAV